MSSPRATRNDLASRFATIDCVAHNIEVNMYINLFKSEFLSIIPDNV